MHSFAVIVGFAATASAAAYGYPAYNSSSVAPPTYQTSSAVAYPVYSASKPAYPVSSSMAYPEYPSYTTTKVVTGLTTVCPEPTTVTYGSKTYTVKSSTTIIDNDCEYTTTYAVKPTPSASASKAIYTPPAAYSSAPPAPMYPSAPQGSNATAVYPTGAMPSATKPTSPAQFTGAAGQAGVGLMAVIGAVAAFL